MFETVHAELDGPEKLQQYRVLNMKKKIDPEELDGKSVWEKGGLMQKN